MNRYLLTPSARHDLSAIWDYTAEQWGIEQAENYIRDLQNAIEFLAEKPERGRAREDVKDGYRSNRCGKHMLFYKDFPGRIEVIRILHQRMDFESHV